MFKTKEELILKDATDAVEFHYVYGYNLGVKDTFKSFAERVEFYKKWSKFGAEPWRLRSEN